MVPADLVVLKDLDEREALVRGKQYVPSPVLAVLHEEQPQLHALEHDVLTEVAALVLPACRGRALVQGNQFLPRMPVLPVLILPVPVLRHADDVDCAICYPAYVLDEADSVEPAVGEEIGCTDASLPCTANHAYDHVWLFLVKFLLPLVAGGVGIAFLPEQSLAFPGRQAVVAPPALLGMERTVKGDAALPVEETEREQLEAGLVPAVCMVEHTA